MAANKKTSSADLQADTSRDMKPLPWDRSAPAFHCRELGGDIKPGQMSRHFLVLGETGSGKTQSVVDPLVRSCAAYRAEEKDHRAAMLVIDPKVELDETVRKAIGGNSAERLIELSLSRYNYRIDYFEGEDRATLTGRAIMDKLLEFSPEFKRSITHGGDDVMWSKGAQELVESLVDIDLAMRRQGQDFWKLLLDWQFAHFHKLGPYKYPKISYERDNYFDSFQLLLATASKLAGSGDDATPEQAAFWTGLIEVAKEAGVDPQISDPLLGFVNLYSSAYLSFLRLANSLLNDLSLPDLTEHVSLNPFEPPSNVLSIRDAIEDGKIIIFTPDTTLASAINVGKALKSKYFQFTFRRKNKARAVVYACDEFQRFITGDPVSGEQSFLDRCRAYRAICVLATQSLSALHYELKQTDPSNSSELALGVMINNTANKYFFRNTDVATADRVERLIPAPPVQAGGKPSIIAARPMSTLKPGECYYLLSDGSWGRKQIELA